MTAGAVLYQANCARCHGAELEGGRAEGGQPAPSLASRTSRSDAALTQTVNRGRGQMPAFRDQLTESEIASIIDFVRSVQAARIESN